MVAPVTSVQHASRAPSISGVAGMVLQKQENLGEGLAATGSASFVFCPIGSSVSDQNSKTLVAIRRHGSQIEDPGHHQKTRGVNHRHASPGWLSRVGFMMTVLRCWRWLRLALQLPWASVPPAPVWESSLAETIPAYPKGCLAFQTGQSQAAACPG